MKKRKKAERTADGRILVRSKAYGDHYRAPRGTYKEAVLNPEMKKSGVAQVKANSDAKLIRSALEPHFFEPGEGAFWHRLLSKVRLSYDAGLKIRPEKLQGFDVYRDYKITRLISPQHRIEINDDSIKLTLSWDTAPDFKRKFPDGYMFAALCAYIDTENQGGESLIQYSEAFPLTHNSGTYKFSFDQKPCEFVLLFLILNATEQGVMHKGAATSGFRCIWGRRQEDMTSL